MKIVLVGYMGSGKSAIGKLLAEEMELKFIDLDSYIEDQLNTTIAVLFEDKGEIYFRKKEHEYLKEVLEKTDNFVLATGGGTPCYSGNLHAMLEGSDGVIYIKVSIAELIQRLYTEKVHRPLIAHLDKNELPEFIGKHLFERSPFYSMANHTVVGDNKSLGELTGEIKALLT